VALAGWDVVSGRATGIPPTSRARLYTQVPAIVLGSSLVTPDGLLALSPLTRTLARRLALMPSLPSPRAPRARAALAPLLGHGVLANQDLPREIRPSDPAHLDGWRFA
jgi:hypothetical protein